jgi:hypothetical protein
MRCHPERKYGESSPHKIPWETIDFTDNVWGEDDIISSTDGF